MWNLYYPPRYGFTSERGGFYASKFSWAPTQPYFFHLRLDWKNFSLSKPVKKALKRAKTRSEDVPSVGVRCPG